MESIKNMFGQSTNPPHERIDEADTANTPNERGVIQEALDTSSLSWSTRVQGFAACFVIGLFISILATVMFSITLNLYTFGILYTLGNVVAICSTLFLMGPVNQIKRMFHSTRWIASTVMLLCLVLTLVSAFVLKKKAMTIMFCIFQFLAMTWYALSYIPFARDAVKRFVDSVIG